ncbi:site-specific DNA-methyltransferase [Anaerocolumna sedimenticola]|uniref:Site-specific DNA-methyltransferase n=1 Tax=Anaerocolumna sedimenticola TaxID=2696063 RepID=A0A6P1TNT8_9FIRM|nr:site-specific DNA-methyltransferase [Anaerocolumna sedimenticola]QHQ61476.1 site-specific DNA-methyltransferase [Anaerocolumna sedimenticola]
MNKYEKLAMCTSSLADNNFAVLAKLFPNAVTEMIDENGTVVRAIDADVLSQEINTRVVSGKEERYQFTWPDKKKSVLLANSPIAAALRPCREESVDFDTTENLYIEGDNLDVLKLLRETYLNRVKMIYIDPPYNTSNDFIYNDDFSEDTDAFLSRDGQYDEQGNRLVKNLDSNGRFHTDWLNMVYPRLRVARDLLADDGVIFISISEEEVHAMKTICNEIFGQSNFRNTIFTRRYDKNLNRQFMEQGLFSMNTGLEYILMYSKSPDTKFNPVFREASEERAATGYWKGFWNDADRPTMRYDILGVMPESGQWKWKHEVANEAVENYIEYVKHYQSTMTLEEYWEHTGKTKKFIRRNPNGNGKNKGVEHWVAPAEGILRNTNWSDLLASKPTGVDVPFDSPKNAEVLLELVKLSNVEDDGIVLDFFSGSATTAHAVMQLNAEDSGKRKFIMVQLPEVCPPDGEAAKVGYKTICEIGKERIRRAGKKIKEENKDKPGIENLDIGFRVLKLDSSNMKDVYYKPEEYAQMSFVLDDFIDNIKEDRTDEDLLFQVMLDLGIPLSSKIEQDGKVFYVDDNYLIACFDKIDIALITEIAKRQPYYAVFRDSSFTSDSALVNFEQVFNTYSPKTIRRVL